MAGTGKAVFGDELVVVPTGMYGEFASRFFPSTSCIIIFRGAQKRKTGERWRSCRLTYSQYRHQTLLEPDQQHLQGHSGVSD